MSDFKKRVPANAQELRANLQKLHENIKHVNKAWVDPSTGRLMVDLDWSANKFGGDAGADFYMPIQKDKQQQAEDLVKRLISQSRSGFAPGEADASALYDMIDPQGS